MVTPPNPTASPNANGPSVAPPHLPIGWYVFFLTLTTLQKLANFIISLGLPNGIPQLSVIITFRLPTDKQPGKSRHRKPPTTPPLLLLSRVHIRRRMSTINTGSQLNLAMIINNKVVIILSPSMCLNQSHRPPPVAVGSVALPVLWLRACWAAARKLLADTRREEDWEG